MAEVALVPSTLSEQPEKKAWERMDGESTRWYSRYKRFQGLGPKRTVLAAVEQERKQSKAPKSTRSQEKPKPKKPASVPGSWNGRQFFRLRLFLASRDRKSTPLNSSHQIISYAAFFFKKKKNNTHHS